MQRLWLRRGLSIRSLIARIQPGDRTSLYLFLTPRSRRLRVPASLISHPLKSSFTEIFTPNFTHSKTPYLHIPSHPAPSVI